MSKKKTLKESSTIYQKHFEISPSNAKCKPKNDSDTRSLMAYRSNL